MWYSTDGETFTTDSVDEVMYNVVVNALDSDETVVVGDEFSYYEGVRYDPVPSDFTSDIAHSIIEQIQCSADDEIGEWADGIGYCSKDALNELNEIVSTWADKHLSVYCFLVKSSKEVKFIVTKKLLDEVI